MQIKEARDGARGPGDLGLRGPERSVDIELSSPDQRSKKRTIPIWYRSFFKRETGIEAFFPVARVFQRLARGNLATGRGRSVRFTGYYVSLLPKVGEPPQAAVLPPTFET